MASLSYNDSGHSIKHFIFDEKTSKMTEDEQDYVIHIEKSQKNEFHPIIDRHEYRYDSDLSNSLRIKSLKHYCIKSIQSYRCIQRECYGRVYVYKNEHKTIGYSLEREHGKHCNRNTNKYIERKLINSIVDRAISCDYGLSKQDYEKEKKDAKDNYDIDLPTFDALKKRIYRKKQTFKTNQDNKYKEKEIYTKSIHTLYADMSVEASTHRLILDNYEDDESNSKIIFDLANTNNNNNDYNNNKRSIKRVCDSFDDEHDLVKNVKRSDNKELIHSNDSVDSTFRNETGKENQKKNRLIKMKQRYRNNKIRNYPLSTPIQLPHTIHSTTFNKEHLKENEKVNSEMKEIAYVLLSLRGGMGSEYSNV